MPLPPNLSPAAMKEMLDTLLNVCSFCGTKHNGEFLMFSNKATLVAICEGCVDRFHDHAATRNALKSIPKENMFRC
jgi:ribosome-binding protein aMBF1 (putative translation factor)